MAKFVIANFEDPPETQGRSAKATQEVLTDKWQAKNPDNNVIEHRCITNHEGRLKLIEGDRLNALRADCLAAQKIYVVMHGDPQDTKNAYANRFDAGDGYLLIGDYKLIAKFLTQILPEHPCNVALVMCFGAMPKQSNTEAIRKEKKPSKDELRTSFAYRLYRTLCGSRVLRMTAVSREIRHDRESKKAMVMDEILLDETIAKIDTLKKIVKSEGALNVQYNQYMIAKRQETRAKIDGYKENKNLPANDEFERFAKAYAEWERKVGDKLKAKYNDAKEGYESSVNRILYVDEKKVEFAKYGKYVYTAESGILKIESKYANEPRGIKPGEVLYEGGFI